MYFVPYFNPCLAALSVSRVCVCVCVLIPDSFVLPLTLLSFLLHLQTSWSRVLLLASADPLGIVYLE